jgi:hypothetical protein
MRLKIITNNGQEYLINEDGYCPALDLRFLGAIGYEHGRESSDEYALTTMMLRPENIEWQDAKGRQAVKLHTGDKVWQPRCKYSVVPVPD